MNSRDNIQKYLIDSVEKQNAQNRERSVHGNTMVMIKDFPTTDADLDAALRQIEHRIPLWCFSNVDIIYIGSFDVFLERGIEAVYENGAIYVFNDLLATEDFVETIGHEVAHAVEEIATGDIYADGTLEIEFIGKRRRLRDILIAHDYRYVEGDFLDPEYDEKLDHFLHADVGYPVLTSLSAGLFMSPYASTSLREYFANGFEWYFLKDQKSFLKQISPVLYNKLDKLADI